MATLAVAMIRSLGAMATLAVAMISKQPQIKTIYANQSVSLRQLAGLHAHAAREAWHPAPKSVGDGAWHQIGWRVKHGTRKKTI